MTATASSRRKVSRDDPLLQDLPKLLTLRQAAGVLQVHQRTVRRLIDRDLLPALKPGGRLRVRRDALQRFLEEAAL